MSEDPAQVDGVFNLQYIGGADPTANVHVHSLMTGNLDYVPPPSAYK